MTDQGYEESHDEGSGETGPGRGARGEARKQGEGIGHDRTSRVWGRGGPEGKRGAYHPADHRLWPFWIVVSDRVEALRLLQSSTWGQETSLP